MGSFSTHPIQSIKSRGMKTRNWRFILLLITAGVLLGDGALAYPIESSESRDVLEGT